MNEIMVGGPSGIISLLHSKGGELAPIKPFEQDIFLLEIQVAGTNYIKNMDEIESSLEEGVRFDLFREPHNPHDPYAIVIKSLEGHKIGYIAKRDNVVFARLMDAGKLLFGKLKSKERKGRWLKIIIEVYLHD